MAYNKQYPKPGDDQIEWNKKQEDRIEEGFGKILRNIKVEKYHPEKNKGYFKFENGLLIVYGMSTNETTDLGGWSTSFPHRFIDRSYGFSIYSQLNETDPHIVMVTEREASYFAVRALNPDGTPFRYKQLSIGYLAIGRWK